MSIEREGAAIMVSVGGVEYEVIEEVGHWDWDWMIGALLRGPDGQLYFAVDAGCSCFTYGDNLGTDDLIKVASPHAAIELAKESFSDVEVSEFAKRLLL